MLFPFAAAILCALQSPTDDWLDLFLAGSRALERGEASVAIARLDRALELLPAHAATTYQLACAHAREGDREEALKRLGAAIAFGYTDAALFRWDRDLDSLRGQARFEALVEALPARDSTSPPSMRIVAQSTGALISATPHGERVAISGGAAPLVWDTRTGSIVSVLSRRGETVDSAVYSPDGRFLVVTGRDAGQDDFTRVLDGASDDVLFDLPAAAVRVGQVTFSDDGRRVLIASGAGDALGTIWDTSNWSLAARVPAGFEQVAFAPDGTKLLLVVPHEPGRSSRGDIAIWDVDRRALIVRHDIVVTAPRIPLGFTRDGGLAFAQDRGHDAFHLFEARSGKWIGSISPPDAKLLAAVSTGQQNELATIDDRGRLTFWDVDRKSATRSYDVSSTCGFVLRASPRGDVVLVQGSDRPVEAYDRATGERLWTASPDGARGVSRGEFISGGESVVIARQDGGAVIVGARTGDVRATLLASDSSEFTSLQAKGEHVWLGYADGTIREVDARTGRTARTIDLGTRGFRWFEFDVRSDGRQVATVGPDGVCHAAELASNPPTATPLFQLPVCVPAYSPHLDYAPRGSLCVVEACECWLDIVDTTTWTHRLRVASGSFAWNDDGSHLAIGRPDELEIVDLLTEPPTSRRMPIKGWKSVLAFEPGTERLWIGRGDRSVIDVVDLQHGTVAFELDHQPLDPIDTVEFGSITFQPDGDVAVVGTSGYGFVAAWSRTKRNLLWSYDFSSGAPSYPQCTFFDDGRRLAVSGQSELSPRIVDPSTGRTIVDLGTRWIGSLTPSRDGRSLLARTQTGLEVLDPDSGMVRLRLHALRGASSLSETSMGFVDGPRSVLDRVHFALDEGSYAMDGLAAAVVDPKKVAAFAAGVRIAPVTIGERPSLAWTRALPRVIRVLDRGSKTTIEADARASDGVLAFELLRNGVRERLAPTSVGGTTEAHLSLDAVLPDDADVLEIRIRAIARNGLASRPLFVALER